MFGRASDQLQPSAAHAGGDVAVWGNLDFDVDLLAEYLLEDTDGLNPSDGGVTFDFNMDASKRTSSMISPDNSEDGVHPPLADKSISAPTLTTNMALLRSAQPYGHVPTASAPLLMPSNTPLMQSGLVTFTQQSLTTDAADVSNKRRRLDILPHPADQQLLGIDAAMVGGRGRKKSQAQIDRRRERNRILARRTRLRKKFFFESLQKEIMDLQRENEQLKEICREELNADVSQKILDECNAMEKLPSSILEQCAQEIAMDNQDANLVKAIQQSQYAFCITDPSLHDHPIVYASDDFLNITGYTREQILGRNCRFLQGPDTDPEHVKELRDAIARGEDISVTILNYTATGVPFWNKLFVAALRDADNNIVNHIGVVVRVPSPHPTNPSGRREDRIGDNGGSGNDTGVYDDEDDEDGDS